MKTTVIIKSEDRNLFGIIVPQETNQGMLCTSSLQIAYDLVRKEKGWSLKRIANIMETQGFIERAYYLLKDAHPTDEFLNTGFRVFKEKCDKDSINKILKQYNWWCLKGKGTERTAWCNPYIWVSLALEFNPEIYAKVIKWLTDGLVFARLEAGTKYLPLTTSIQKYLEPNFPITSQHNIYANIAILINQATLKNHYQGIRNFCTKEQLSLISEAEQKIQALIEFGLIKNEDDVKNALVKIFTNR